MADHGRRRWRLVLTSSPLQGHMTPMLHLATALHSKGFSITIAHSKMNPPKASNHPDFDFLSLDDSSSGIDASSGINQFLKTLNDNCKGSFHDYLVELIKAQKETYEKESIVVVHDSLMFFAASIAGDLGLPSFVLRSGSAIFVPAYKIIPKLHQAGQLPVQDSTLEEMVPEVYPFRYKDLPFIRMPVQEALQMIDMVTLKTPPSAFIWNTIEFLEESALTHVREHYQLPLFAIGPLHKMVTSRSTSFLEEDASCVPWLDKKAPKSVIYVSLGSLATVDEGLLVEMAWGLANSNQPFLWVVRPGSVHGSKWIEFLPDGLIEEIKDRGLIVKWAPQKEVLEHIAIGGFWSHCGWNSTLESIAEGVPMLCQPFNTDQGLNTRYISYVWKMGLEIDVERGAIERAIKTLLVEREGEEMRRKAKEIREKVNGAMSDGGSSHNSLNDLVEFIVSL